MLTTPKMSWVRRMAFKAMVFVVLGLPGHIHLPTIFLPDADEHEEDDSGSSIESEHIHPSDQGGSSGS